ncbi:MAG: hypothetical protein SXV54_12385 [Chloroflexota bacterium]|nr:hypothetical protein [Chloroflexota bacterium]
MKRHPDIRTVLFGLALALTFTFGVTLTARGSAPQPAVTDPDTPVVHSPAENPPKIDFLTYHQDQGIESTGQQLAPNDAAAAPTTEWTFHRTSDNLHPDGNEQQAVWLMNRARANPTQEGIWLATTDDPDVAGGRNYFGVDIDVLQSEFAGYEPKPPAAFDVRLYNAAKEHSDDLITRDAQDHTGQYDRVIAAGFSPGQYRGNVFSYADSSLNAHAAWNIDWGFGTPDGMQTGRGHRMAIMSVDGDYTNVGIAMVGETNPATDVGPLVSTGNYCYAGSGDNLYNRFLVGTVWQDSDGDSMYDPGEGIAGVTVTPDSGTYYAVTSNSGGYAIPLTSPGTYEVTFSGPVSAVQTVIVGEDSVLLDQAVGAEPAPTVTSVSPSSGVNTGTVHITNLAGHNFVTTGTTTVALTRSGQTPITATLVTVVSESQITCDFDLTGAATGLWNVVVTNPDGQSGMLSDGFTVNAAPAPDVSISKQVFSSDPVADGPIVFTLAIANVGDGVASQAIVTDALPSAVLSPTFASTLPLVQETGVPSYVWRLDPLEPGASGVISIYGQIESGTEVLPFVNTAIISDPDDSNPDNNTSSVTVGESRVYLPLVTQNWSLTPSTQRLTVFEAFMRDT